MTVFSELGDAPNKVQRILKIVFRWWVCLKRKMMVLHLLLSAMMALRFQHFTLNCCISVLLFLWLSAVFGQNSGSAAKKQMMEVGDGDSQPPYAYALELFLPRVTMLVWDLQPEQTLSAEQLRLQLPDHAGRCLSWGSWESQLLNLQIRSSFHNVWIWHQTAVSPRWLWSSFEQCCLHCVLRVWSCCMGRAAVCAAAAQTAHRQWSSSDMWYHFIGNYFIPVFLSHHCDKY